MGRGEGLRVEKVAAFTIHYPVRSLIADGEGHTFLSRNFDGGTRETTVREWITEMLNLSDRWISVSD